MVELGLGAIDFDLVAGHQWYRSSTKGRQPSQGVKTDLFVEEL